jgi:hypothetical protein
MSQVDTLREIALSREIDRQLDTIVQVAGSLAAQLKGSSMRENQLRNVLDVSLHTESIEVVGNYIRYQIGRGGSWKSSNFGENVIAALGDGGPVQGAARKVAYETHKTLRGAKTLGEAELPEPADLEREARVLLTRLFLGYLNRWFLYADREKTWDKIGPMVKIEEEASA